MTADSILNIDGQTVHVRRAGAGAPVLVLHGWGASIEAMQLIRTKP
jgi:hypothetical protein